MMMTLALTPLKKVKTWILFHKHHFFSDQDNEIFSILLIQIVTSQVKFNSHEPG